MLARASPWRVISVASADARRARTRAEREANRHFVATIAHYARKETVDADRREECGDRGKRGQDKHQHPGSRSGIQDPLVHGPDAAERQRRIDPLERSSQARGDGRRVRPTRDEVHRTKWELSMRVIDGRLGRATERCMLHVCNNANDPERDVAGEVSSERSDVGHRRNDPQADRIEVRKVLLGSTRFCGVLQGSFWGSAGFVLGFCRFVLSGPPGSPHRVAEPCRT